MCLIIIIIIIIIIIGTKSIILSDDRNVCASLVMNELRLVSQGALPLGHVL